jgi:hypothetical protein
MAPLKVANDFLTTSPSYELKFLSEAQKARPLMELTLNSLAITAIFEKKIVI